MKRVIVHWTGGVYKPNALDKKSYHVLVAYDQTTQKAYIVEGDKPPEAKLAMGIALCGMLGASESGYPIKQCQYDLMIEEVAAYAKGYGIPITPTTVLLHSEVNHNLKVNERYKCYKWDVNKWDVSYSLRESFMSAQYAGEMLRERVQAVIDHNPADVL